jgi:hypothetical protein
MRTIWSSELENDAVAINGDESFEEVIEFALNSSAAVITYTRDGGTFTEGPSEWFAVAFPDQPAKLFSETALRAALKKCAKPNPLRMLYFALSRPRSPKT